MALQKSKTTKGVSADYWVIVSTSWEKESNKTHVSLNLFASSEARQLGLGNALEGISFTFDGELTRQEEYAKIKETEFFSDAVDC